MLGEVKLPDPEAVLDRYPHQLSGGQQQRIVIAMALIAEPALLIMDEPTTGLDVTVEAAVLDLVRELRHRHDAAILFISHNLGTVVRVCDRIGVMYAGELVEEGTIRAVFANPRHPYTRGLLDCLPDARPRQAPGAAGPDPRPAGRAARPAARLRLRRRAARTSMPARCESAPIPTVAGRRRPGTTSGACGPPSCRAWRRRGEATGCGPRPAARGETVLAVERLRKNYRPRRGLLAAPAPARVRALNDVDLAARAGPRPWPSSASPAAASRRWPGC